MSAIFIDGQIAHYEVIGRGKPIFFLHSWFGSWRYWVPTMQVVSQYNRAYAIDFWGFGESAKNKHYSIKMQAELLHSFFETIGLFQCTIVGHGLGALIAAEFSRSFPDYVDKLMLIAYPFSRDQLNHRIFEGEQVGLVEKLVKNTNDLEAIRNDEIKNDPNAIKTSVKELLLENDPSSNISFNKTSLLVYGMKDLIIKSPSMEEWTLSEPTTHLIGFENSGHFPMLEESSKFSRLLSEFLELSEEDSPRNLHIKEKWQRRVR